jgi:methionyl-tRNA formyltransferase
MTLRLAFMGTPDFAAASLAEIVGAGHEVAAVYTQPPRRRGRGQSETPTPVHALADQFGLPVHTPKTFRDEAVLSAFEALDLDAACVVAYGQILPQRALDAPRLGCLNLHGSLLPRWRGAAPIQRAVMAGDTVTGVQIMQMEEGLDTGPVLMSETLPIAPGDTAGSLHDRMKMTGALLWARTLAALERGSLTAALQSAEGVTYARKITGDDRHIDWTQPAGAVADQIRGLSPVPGAWFETPGDKPVRVKVHFAEPHAGQGEPGEVLDDALLIACGHGAVRLTRVQREGKGVVDGAEFGRTGALPAGAVVS